MRLHLLLICTTLVFLALPLASQAGNGPGRCKKDGWEIEASGTTDPRMAATDPKGEVLVSVDNADGRVLRVGTTSAWEPHLLLGHRERVFAVAVSPDGRWIASSAQDGSVRLWPMPDVSKPPIHTLPHDELIAKFHSLTNLRAVRDEESSTGWKIEIGPFPGWETVPTW